MEKEHEIGEIITLPDGRKAEVVEEIELSSCLGCIYIDEACPAEYCCWCGARTDQKNIIYKEVKEEK